MSSVCILGAGELGGAVAQALTERERVSRVLLVDDAGSVAAGKALDLQQAAAIAGRHTHVDGTSDANRIAGYSVYVIADRFGQTGTEWQDEEGLGLLVRLAPLVSDRPVVFAGASQSQLLLSAAGEVHIRREQLIGSAPEALASAIRSIVAMEARCSPGEVMLTVLGAAPAGFVVPWSEASIGGYALDRVLSQVQLTRIEARAARLWPPGPFAMGLAAARVVEALLESSRRAFSVLTVLSGEFGVRNRVAALPARLSFSGIVQTRTPLLNTRERVQLETALGA